MNRPLVAPADRNRRLLGGGGGGEWSCLHGTQDHEVVTTKHNWSAWCQYNVTGWVSIWACDMLSQ